MGRRLTVTVRPALERELPEVLALLLLFHKEMKAISLNREKLIWRIDRVFREGVILIAIRGGKPVGTMGISPAQWWFSDDWYLGDFWMFVRKGDRRSTAAADILKKAKEFSDRVGLPLFTDVMNMHETKRKNSLYRRHFTTVGERFVHGLDNLGDPNNG